MRSSSSGLKDQHPYETPSIGSGPPGLPRRMGELMSSYGIIQCLPTVPRGRAYSRSATLMGIVAGPCEGSCCTPRVHVSMVRDGWKGKRVGSQSAPRIAGCGGRIVGSRCDCGGACRLAPRAPLVVVPPHNGGPSFLQPARVLRAAAPSGIRNDAASECLAIQRLPLD